MTEKVISAKFGNTPYQHTAEDVLKQIEEYIEEDDFLKPDSPHPNAAVEVPMDLDELRNLVSYVRALERKGKENNRISIGKYTITEHNLKVGCVSIHCNEKSDCQGEGGTFDEAELEKVIGDFYAKHF